MAMRYSAAALRKSASSIAALIVVITSGPTVTASAALVPPSASGRFVDHHGPVLPAVQLYIVYWGSRWTATDVPSSPDQITTAMRTVMASSYLTGLAQYRGIGRGSVRGSTVITTSDPPSNFTDDDVSTLISAEFEAGAIPGPDPDNQTMYVVVMPVGISAGGDSQFVGEHNYYTRHGQRIHFAWTADSGSLANATRIMSHELVEAATDPEGTAMLGVPGTCSASGWCEIADICPGDDIVDGVRVASYWSNVAGGCVVPTSPHPSAGRAP